MSCALSLFNSLPARARPMPTNLLMLLEDHILRGNMAKGVKLFRAPG